MAVNNLGRTFSRGKSLTNDFWSLIIDEIVENGGDIITGFFPGSFNDVARKLRVHRNTVNKVWKTFCTSRDFKLPKPISSGVRHLQPQDLQFVEFLKTNRPSMTTGKLLRNVNGFCVLHSGTSKQALNRAVRNFMPGGKWSWKRMVRPSAEKFTPENIQYCHLTLSIISLLWIRIDLNFLMSLE